MRVKNNKTENWPLVSHGNGPGKNTRDFEGMVQYMRESNGWQERIPLNEDITVLTWSIPEEDTLLQESFRKMGIESELIVIPISKPFNWLDKIKKTMEYLPFIKTKYVVGLDSTDVIVSTDKEGQGTLWYDMKETFKKMNCSLCFNAEKLSWPTSGGVGMNLEEDGKHGNLVKALKKTEEFEIKMYKDYFNSDYYRLNSGAFIGYTEYTTDFYNSLWDKYVKTVYERGEDEGMFGGDQGFIRIMQNVCFPDLLIDYKAMIFQTFADMNEGDINIYD
jgi:hypothetical protein